MAAIWRSIFCIRAAECVLLDLEPLTEPELFGKVEAIKGDVRNEEQVAHAMNGCDTVVHAAMALPLASKKDILTTGIDGTHIVLEQAKKQHIARVLHISSTAVYGVPDHHPLVETDKKVGVGPYGAAKVAAEESVEAARQEGQVVAALRPKTFIGTGRLGVFHILFDWIERGCRIPLIGSGSNRYQLLAVSDLCEAAFLCLTEKKEKINDTFNVGAMEYGTVAEDMQKLITVAGSKSSVLPTPAAATKTALAALEAVNLSPLYKWIYGTADTDSFVSTNKIETVLGWRAKKSNADALIEAYEWYKKAWPSYEKQTGTTHRAPWKQGALKVARWMLEPKKS